MGMASSLHCASLCGGIASSLLLRVPGSTTVADQTWTLLATQAGRVVSYVFLGALVGAFSTIFSSIVDLEGAQSFLRLLAAMTLILTGLSIAGALPSISGLDRFLPNSFLARSANPLTKFRRVEPVLAGILWGLAPCGMVYVALMNAMLSGSAISGFFLMAGFGIATVPPVALTALGVNVLISYARAPKTTSRLRSIIGLVIVALGTLSTIQPAIDIAELCQ